MLCSEFDPNPHAIINPEDLIQPIPGFPEICVMVFSNHIAEMCLRRWGGEHIAQVKCCVGDMPIYRVIVDGTEVALSTPYVGGPAAATFIEEVWPLGGKYFVFFGAAGVLDRNIPLNSFILPTAAVRDEGLSYHYLPPAEESGPGPRLCGCLPGSAGESGPALYPGQNLDHRRLLSGDSGASWPAAREQGCVSVEMECASLAAVAQFRGVRFAQFFYTTDNLDGPVWDNGVLGQHGASVAEECIAAAVETGRRLTQL